MGGWMVGGREGKKEERRIKGKGRKKEGRRRIFVVFSPLLFFSFSLYQIKQLTNKNTAEK